jgi:hypothetical protein
MSIQAPPPAERLAPPDERFWRRYSRHHELPLSSVGSLTLHLLVLIVVALFTVRAIIGPPQPRGPQVTLIGIDDPTRPEILTVKPGAENGEDVGAQTSPEPNQPGPRLLERPQLGIVKAIDNQIQLPGARSVASGTLQDGLEDLRKKVGDKIPWGIGKRGIIGRGDPNGPNLRLPERQVQRMQRWVLTIEANSGPEFVRKLRALGAILAIPKFPNYVIVRDLSLSRRPPPLLVEDLSAIRAIFWINQDPKTVGDVMSALGIAQKADHFAAFISPKVEEQLYTLEKKKYNLSENQIERTEFRLRAKGVGYEPYVYEQARK